MNNPVHVGNNTADQTVQVDVDVSHGTRFAMAERK